MFEDMNLWLDCFTSFVGGLVGIDPKTVIGAVLLGVGSLMTVLSRRIGRASRSVFARIYGLAQWCLSKNQLTPGAKTLMDMFDHKASLDEANDLVVFDRFKFVVNHAGQVSKVVLYGDGRREMDVEPVLSRYDRKVVFAKALSVRNRLLDTIRQANNSYVATFLDSVEGYLNDLKLSEANKLDSAEYKSACNAAGTRS